jgi:hypothetical protein
MNRDHTMGFVMTICRHITHHVTETFKPCSSACRPQVPLPEVVRGGRQALRGRSIANPNETLENMNELMDDKKPHDCDETTFTNADRRQPNQKLRFVRL